MRSRKIFTHKQTFQKGFSLIEVLVVTGLLTFLAGVGIVVSMQSYRGYLFRSERDLLVAVLESARSRALKNIGETPHGVHIEPDAFVLFAGAAYSSVAPENERIPRNSSVTISEDEEIIFSQLSGDAASSSIVVSDGVHIKRISINDEGRIDW